MKSFSIWHRILAAAAVCYGLCTACGWSAEPPSAAAAVSPLAGFSPQSVRDALLDAAQRWPKECSLTGARKELLADLPQRYAQLTKRLQAQDLAAVKEAQALASLVHKALLTIPVLTRQPLLYTRRHQYRRDHHNTETLFQPGEINTSSYLGGGVLKVYDVASNQSRVLVDFGPEGLVRDVDVSWDGQRLLFAARKNREDSYHLYECRGDGSGLKALTRAAGVSDINPVYLPDDDILFVSTREPKYCMCNRHIMGNLFRMRGDGANIVQVGKSTLFEGHPFVMPDGRILYDRWEYVDMNFGTAQALWTMNPDGTGHAIYWGSNLSSPGGKIQGRIVPGSGLCLAIFAACHDRPWGALALLDRRLGVETRESIVRTWPPSAKDLYTVGGFDSTLTMPVKYQDPWPLDEQRFLVSRMTGPGHGTGIYYVDLFGNEVPVITEGPGCFEAKPLTGRPRPAVIPTRRDFTNGPGTFVVRNAYVGTHMKGVAPGSIKTLRVVESPEKRNFTMPWWSGQGGQFPAMNWDSFENKRVLGTVPVEADGSACFECPSDRFIFFQLLDEKGRLIQSMRTGTFIQSGEVQGCIGCHEDRNGSYPNAGRAMTLRRPPQALHPPPHGVREISFYQDVQPILTRRCVGCHDFGKPAGKKLNLAPDRDLVFNVAYVELYSKRQIACVGAGQADHLMAYAWGSTQSNLIRLLDRGHENVKLSPEEMETLTTWIDLNGPYYPKFESAYPEGVCGRGPLSEKETATLCRLAGIGLNEVTTHRVPVNRPWVSFDRPDLSPILERAPADKPKVREEMLALIRQGAQRLQAAPRGDEREFTPCELDRQREARYRQRQKVEQANRASVREGRAVYDIADAGATATGTTGALPPAQAAGHRLLKAGCHGGSLAIVAADGKIEWEYPMEDETNDAWLLAGGHIVFAHRYGVREVTRDKKTVWEYNAPRGAEIHSCQPLEGGIFLIGQTSQNVGHLHEIDCVGTIHKTITLPAAANAHAQFRQVRKTPQGTYLVTYQGNRGKAIEVDGGGKILRTFPGGQFTAIRLPYGNTLISGGDEHRVIEVDQNNRIVWQVCQNDIPGNVLDYVAGLQRLPNGNTVICNWTGHSGRKSQAQVFEITRDKKLVWELKDPKLHMISSVEVLDDNLPAIPPGQALR